MPLKVDLALGKLAVDEGLLPTGSLQGLLESQRQQEAQGMYRPLGEALLETQAADSERLDALLVKLRHDIRVRLIQHLGKQLVEDGSTHNVALRSAMRGMRRELSQGKQPTTSSLLNYLDAVGGIEGELDRAALTAMGDRFFAALDYGKLFGADEPDTLALRVAYQRGMATEVQIFMAVWATRAGGEAASALPDSARKQAHEILERAGRLGAAPAATPAPAAAPPALAEPQETIELPPEPAVAVGADAQETVIVAPDVPTVGLANIPDLPTLGEEDIVAAPPSAGGSIEDDDGVVEEITGASFALPDLDLGGPAIESSGDAMVPPTIIAPPPQAAGAFADEADIDTFREAVSAEPSSDLDFTPMPSVDHGPLDLASATQALPSHRPLPTPGPNPGATQPLPSTLPKPSDLPTPSGPEARGGRSGLGRGGGPTDRLPSGQRTGRPMSTAAGRRMTPMPTSGSRHARPPGRRREGGANPLVIAAVVVAVLAVASLMIVGLTGPSGDPGGGSGETSSSDASASSKAALVAQLTEERGRVAAELTGLAQKEDFARAKAVYEAFLAKVNAAKLGESWEEPMAGLERIWTGAQMNRYNELVDQFRTALDRSPDDRSQIGIARGLLDKIKQIVPETEAEQVQYLEDQLREAAEGQ